MRPFFTRFTRLPKAPNVWQRLLGSWSTPRHPADRVFDSADLDRDGLLDRRELAQYMMTLGSDFFHSRRERSERSLGVLVSNSEHCYY